MIYGKFCFGLDQKKEVQMLFGKNVQLPGNVHTPCEPGCVFAEMLAIFNG